MDATGDADVAARAGAPYRKTPKEEMLTVSVMFSMSGVNKRRFIEEVKADPQTYRDWAGNAEWDIATTGKEDELFSPFLRQPFKQAVAAGLIPPNLITLAGTWGSVSDQGDLTYLNLVRIGGLDGTDADDPTRGEIDGRQQAIHAVEALRAYMLLLHHADVQRVERPLGPDRDGGRYARPARSPCSTSCFAPRRARSCRRRCSGPPR